MNRAEEKAIQEKPEEDDNDLLLLTSQNDELKIEIVHLNQENKKLKQYILELEEKLRSLDANKKLEQENDEVETQHTQHIKEIISQEVQIAFDIISQDLQSIKSRLKNLEYTEDKNNKQRLKRKKEATQNNYIEIKNQTDKGKPVTPKQNNELEIKQRQIMNDIINLDPTPSRNKISPPYDAKQNNMDSVEPPYSQTTWAQGVQNVEKDNPNENGKWNTVQRKKSVKKMIGESENNGKFGGAKPKVWMYLYRIKPDVNKADILEYLKEKTKEEESNIVVKELQNDTIYNINGDYKCYMVGADFKFKNEFYNPQFWPKGVGYKRFDFKVHSKYIIPEQRDETNHHHRPDNFLG